MAWIWDSPSLDAANLICVWDRSEDQMQCAPGDLMKCDRIRRRRVLFLSKRSRKVWSSKEGRGRVDAGISRHGSGGSSSTAQLARHTSYSASTIGPSNLEHISKLSLSWVLFDMSRLTLRSTTMNLEWNVPRSGTW